MWSSVSVTPRGGRGRVRRGRRTSASGSSCRKPVRYQEPLHITSGLPTDTKAHRTRRPPPAGIAAPAAPRAAQARGITALAAERPAGLRERRQQRRVGRGDGTGGRATRSARRARGPRPTRSAAAEWKCLAASSFGVVHSVRSQAFTADPVFIMSITRQSAHMRRRARSASPANIERSRTGGRSWIRSAARHPWPCRRRCSGRSAFAQGGPCGASSPSSRRGSRRDRGLRAGGLAQAALQFFSTNSRRKASLARSGRRRTIAGTGHAQRTGVGCDHLAEGRAGLEAIAAGRRGVVPPGRGRPDGAARNPASRASSAATGNARLRNGDGGAQSYSARSSTSSRRRRPRSRGRWSPP